MIHWTVRNNTSRTHRSSANAHLFKLIITHDNKSVDQIERVYIWCCSFQGRTSSSSAREKDRWYYLIKKNEIGPARDARQRVSVILQLSIIPLDSIYSPFRSSTTSWAPNGIEAQRSEWENFKVEEWNRYTHTHTLSDLVLLLIRGDRDDGHINTSPHSLVLAFTLTSVVSDRSDHYWALWSLRNRGRRSQRMCTFTSYSCSGVDRKRANSIGHICPSCQLDKPFVQMSPFTLCLLSSPLQLESIWRDRLIQ